MSDQTTTCAPCDAVGFCLRDDACLDYAPVRPVRTYVADVRFVDIGPMPAMQMERDLRDLTTNPALSAKAKSLVLSALTTYRDQFAIARSRATDEDEIADLDMDISYTDCVIREVNEWKVKRP